MNAQLYTFKNYGHEDGLSMGSISSVMQSKEGMLWLGTAGGGLLNYDGYQFSEFRSSKSDNDHHITSMYEDGSQIVFSSQYKGLYCLTEDNHYEEFFKTKENLGEYHSTFKVGQKTYFVTSKGIFYRKSAHEFQTLYVFGNKASIFKLTGQIILNNSAIVLTSKGNFRLSAKNDRVTTLDYWLHISEYNTKFIEFGYHDKNTVHLFDNKAEKWLEVTLNERGSIFSTRLKNRESSVNPDDYVISTKYNSSSKKGIIVTNKGVLIEITENALNRIVHNSLSPLEQCHDAIVDRNGDFWVISGIKGLYKVSLEPFTEIQLHPIYNTSNIMRLHRSRYGDIILSNNLSETFIGNNKIPNHGITTYNFRTFSVAEIDKGVLLGTEKGIKLFDFKTKSLTNLPIPELNVSKIISLFVFGNDLWIGTDGNGLIRYSLDKLQKKEINLQKGLPSHYYTAQSNKDQSLIYFGTNDGIVVYDRKNNNLKRVKTSKSLGSYIGNSATDSYGNIWFTGEKALVAFLKDGQQRVIDKQSVFSSTLFYTLNADNFGNLIIGTNKGLNVIHVNQHAELISYRWFEGKSGFPGYETNMRSQFQNENNIIVGTVEGVYLINTEILLKLPRPFKPVIRKMNSRSIENKESSFGFQFYVLNPKIKNIEFSYRVGSIKNEWSDFSPDNEIFLSDLPNGKHRIDVRASYDGKTFSEIAFYTFEVQIPFYKSKWFVFFLIAFAVLLNIWFISRNKALSQSKFFKTKDNSITLKSTPGIIFFAMISDTSLHLLCPLIDSEVQNNLGLTLVSGFIQLSIYLLSLNAKKSNQTIHYKTLLIAVFTVTLLHNLIDLYLSSLHPFYILAIVLINAITPFIFDRIKTVLIISVGLVFVAGFMTLTLETTVYNKYLFLLSIIVSSVLCTLSSFLRFDSIEKLLFISSVINKGNNPAIAFNSGGVILYVSENIADILDINHDALLGNHISYLNTYLPKDGPYRKMDLTKEFTDGKTFLSPMISKTGDIIWMEWSCKEFSDDIRVILGQNVSDKMELQNTYELLVEGAEDLIYQCDINGNFSYLNNRFQEKLGYNTNELVGTNSLELVPIEERGKVYMHYRNHFEQKLQSSYFEFPILSKDGSIVWIGQHVTTLFKSGNKDHLKGFLALARDITESKIQQETIRQQRDDITSSINYAQKIQVNLLPTRENLSKCFRECCILYKPKDIVSGDFYWMEQIDNKIVIALADCTGHGVPGSFMTLLGINLLNNIILEKRILNPSIILNELDNRLVHALPRDNGEDNINDGMELTICILDPNKEELEYACAGSRFLIYENNNLTMYKGDNKHIGDQPHAEFKGYVTHYTRFSDASTLFLFTDGFQDQFGGQKNKKYSFRRMLEFFEANIRLPLSEQELMLEKEFDKWKADDVQTDDVTILAFRKPIKRE